MKIRIVINSIDDLRKIKEVFGEDIVFSNYVKEKKVYGNSASLLSRRNQIVDLVKLEGEGFSLNDLFQQIKKNSDYRFTYKTFYRDAKHLANLNILKFETVIGGKDGSYIKVFKGEKFGFQ